MGALTTNSQAMGRLSLNSRFCSFMMEGQAWAPMGWLEGLHLSPSAAGVCPGLRSRLLGMVVSGENTVVLPSLLVLRHVLFTWGFGNIS